MEHLITSVLTPENFKSILIVMLGLFAKDFVVGILRRIQKRLLGDKDPKNDGLGELAGAAADSIEKIQIPKGK